MTQYPRNPRLVKRILPATACCAVVALICSAPYFGATLAQTPEVEPPQEPVATATPTPVPTQAPAPIAAPSPSQAYSPAMPQVGDANQQATLNTLRARMQELQSRLTRTPTSVQEQAEQQQIVVELSGLQAQIQKLEAATASFGQYGDYRAFRERQDALAAQGVNPTASALPSFGAASGLGAPSVYANPLASRTPTPALDRAAAIPGGLSEGEAALLREQKESLNQRFRQLQQALNSLIPGDEGLAENLKQEQNVVLEQLRDVNQRLANAPAPAPAPIVSEPTPFQIPAANQLPNLANAALPDSDLAVRTQKVSQAVQLLREAGLVQLAGYAASEIPRMAAPDYAETRLVPGAWTEGSGLAEERYNPFQQISAKDVETINASIDDLKKRVDSLAETLVNVETQLKLLTRQQVSGYTPSAQPVPEVAPNATGGETPAQSEVAPAPTAEEVE